MDAVRRLPVLEDSHYRDLLCEFGAILSIANKVDSIHKLPWIGFQSWRATSRMVFNQWSHAFIGFITFLGVFSFKALGVIFRIWLITNKIIIIEISFRVGYGYVLTWATIYDSNAEVPFL